MDGHLGMAYSGNLCLESQVYLCEACIPGVIKVSGGNLLVFGASRGFQAKGVMS